MKKTTALLAILLAGCQPDNVPTGDVNQVQRVYFAGDSLMYGAGSSLSLMFGFGGYVPVVNGLPFSGVYAADEWAQRLRQMPLSFDYDMIFINLGTNDLGRDPSQYENQITTIVDAIPHRVKINWIAPHDKVCEKYDPIACDEFITTLEKNQRIKSWSFDEWLSSGDRAACTVFDADGVHLTECGSALYAQMMLDIADGRFK